MLRWCLVLILLVPPGDTSGFPCYGCSRDISRRNPQKRQPREEECRRPCNCPLRVLDCSYGVSLVRDGCGCCMMCARQSGDICSRRTCVSPSRDCTVTYPRTPRLECVGNHTISDVEKDSTDCTVVINGQSVLLVHTFFWFKAVNAKPCIVDGVEYKDGAQFQLDCRRTCTCQNGNYGCADLCPQEHIPPSDRFCKNAKLVNVSGTCCRNGPCELSNLTNNKSPRHAMLKSANLVLMSEGKPI
uniref:VWFC domain-containing protein n=1 Tax=Magallana gigas TaxID=29159 RepID=A0A8W8KMS0_MAGGI